MQPETGAEVILVREGLIVRVSAFLETLARDLDGAERWREYADECRELRAELAAEVEP